MIDVTKKAAVNVVAGGSGSGKSAWVKQQTATDKRLLVWDIEGEYTSTAHAVKTLQQLKSVLLRALIGPGRYAYQPYHRDEFEAFCKLAFAWRDCTVIAEELANVTHAGKAPDGWHSIVCRGRKRGIVSYGVTQRPSESDKTIMGNATLIHCGFMSRNQDRAYMARELDCEQVKIDHLKPLQWIEQDRIAHQLSSGTLTFKS